MVNSPTIHASLENNLDRSGLDDDLEGLHLMDGSDGEEERERDVRFASPYSPERRVSKTLICSLYLWVVSK